MIPKAPLLDDKDLKRLMRIIASEYEPLYLNVEPEDNVVQNDCFPSVLRKVEKSGGKMVMGWQIWKGAYLIEAECQAVWEDTEEYLVDITPKPNGINEILFLPDDRLIYEGRQIDSIRLNITRNRLVDHLIEAEKGFFRIRNQGDRAYRYDLSYLTEEELLDIQLAYHYKNNLHLFINSGNNEKSLCYCNSGWQYHNCHESILLKFFRSIKT